MSEKFIGYLIICIMAGFCFVIAIWQHQKKGYVFNNRYIFGSKEERKNRDWTDYYNQTRNTMVLTGFFILSILLNMLFITIGLLILLIAYAIYSGKKLVDKYGL
ncbi:MAG: DUF3784 domain-containing protein [Bacilli bacterium]